MGPFFQKEYPFFIKCALSGQYRTLPKISRICPDIYMWNQYYYFDLSKIRVVRVRTTRKWFFPYYLFFFFVTDYILLCKFHVRFRLSEYFWPVMLLSIVDLYHACYGFTRMFICLYLNLLNDWYFLVLLNLIKIVW